MPRSRTTFAPGRSGNPGGRPRVLGEVREVAQQYGPLAILRLAEMGGLVEGRPGAENESARIAAIKELLDRGYGKAIQQSDITSNGQAARFVIYGERELSTDEWIQRYSPLARPGAQ